MIDNIGFTLPIEAVIPPLEERYINHWGDIQGHFHNFRISEKSSFKYCTGSIAKYLNGENVTTLTIDTLGEALDKLELETGWNLNNTEIKTLEIGATIILKYPVENYLKLWGNMSRTKKIDTTGKELETVMLKTGNKSFQGYNKALESKKNIPLLFQDSNLLRLELKYKKNLKQYLGIISLRDLTNKDLYKKLVLEWKNFYMDIPKYKNSVLDIKGGVTPKLLKDLLACYGLNKYGYDNYMGYLTQLKLDPKQSVRARKEAKELINNSIISEQDKLTEELTSSVWDFIHHTH